MDPGTIEQFTRLIIQGGAIVALVWVIILMVTGRLHTSSEVEGLRKDKEDLLAVNADQARALDKSNELLDRVVQRGG